MYNRFRPGATSCLFDALYSANHEQTQQDRVTTSTSWLLLEAPDVATSSVNVQLAVPRHAKCPPILIFVPERDPQEVSVEWAVDDIIRRPSWRGIRIRGATPVAPGPRPLGSGLPRVHFHLGNDLRVRFAVAETGRRSIAAASARATPSAVVVFEPGASVASRYPK